MLDELYGAGSLAEFAAAVDGEVKEAAIEGGVRLYVTFARGRAKLDCYPLEVVWQALYSDSDEPIGLYDRMAEVTPPFFAARGVRRYVAAPENQEAFDVLTRRLEWTGNLTQIVTAI